MITYRRALDFHTYRLHYRSSRMNSYGKYKVDSRKKRLIVEMVSHLFNPDEPISIMDFLQTFKPASNSLVIHEAATLFLFAHFMQ